MGVCGSGVRHGGEVDGGAKERWGGKVEGGSYATSKQPLVLC